MATLAVELTNPDMLRCMLAPASHPCWRQHLLQQSAESHTRSQTVAKTIFRRRVNCWDHAIATSRGTQFCCEVRRRKHNTVMETTWLIGKREHRHVIIVGGSVDLLTSEGRSVIFIVCNKYYQLTAQTRLQLRERAGHYRELPIPRWHTVQ